MSQVIDQKPRNALVSDIKPLNSQVLDIKPKMNSGAIPQTDQLYPYVQTVGMYMGLPFGWTYTTSGTVYSPYSP